MGTDRSQDVGSIFTCHTTIDKCGAKSRRWALCHRTTADELVALFRLLERAAETRL